MPKKTCKYYGVYYIHSLIDVIAEEDAGLATKWAIDIKGYKGLEYTLRETSMEELKRIKKGLKQRKSEIDVRLANISRYA